MDRQGSQKSLHLQQPSMADKHPDPEGCPPEWCVWAIFLLLFSLSRGDSFNPMDCNTPAALSSTTSIFLVDFFLEEQF